MSGKGNFPCIIFFVPEQKGDDQFDIVKTVRQIHSNPY